MISLQENPTLAIRLGPMAESRLYKIAHPAIFCDLSFVCPIQTGLTDHAITESDQRVISLTPLLFFLRAQNCWGSVRNYSTAWRIDLTSVWCRHANVEGICPASRRLFAACKRLQRRLREGGPDRTGF